MKLLKIHFWVLIVGLPLLALGIGLEEFFDDTPKEIINSFFTIAGFIPYYCYIYKRQFLSRDLWRPFIVGYFLWELLCYFTYGNSLSDNIIVFISIVPKYLAVAMYGLYIGSFRLPEIKTFEEIENFIFSNVLYKFILSASIILNLSLGFIGLFAILNPDAPQI